MTRIPMRALVVVVCVCVGAVTVASALPANAGTSDLGPGDTSTSPPPTAPVNNPGYWSLEGTSCGAYVSSVGMGGGCAQPSGTRSSCAGECKRPPTWQEIIDEHSAGGFDPCRVQRIPEGFTTPAPRDDDPDKQWLVQLCMTGFELNSVDGGDDIELSIARTWGEFEEEPWWMRYIWSDVSEGQESLPFPVLEFGPQYPQPVVGAPTYFWASFNRVSPDGAAEPVDVPYEVHIGDDAGDGRPVYLVAELEGLQIETGDVDPGTGQPARVDCGTDWANRFRSGVDDVETFASDCAWTYQRSSADQDDESYEVVAEARWRVGWRKGSDASAPLRPLDGGELSLVTTSMRHDIRVREVQVHTSPAPR